MMSNPNLGPELSDSSNSESTESNRRGNPASAYLDEAPAGEIEAAQARATTVSHRFGGTRYALSRPVPAAAPAGDGAGDSPAEPPGDTDADTTPDDASGNAAPGTDEPGNAR